MRKGPEVLLVWSGGRGVVGVPPVPLPGASSSGTFPRTTRRDFDDVLLVNPADVRPATAAEVAALEAALEAELGVSMPGRHGRR